MEATCQYSYLYRLLRSDEYPQVNGIAAQWPGGTVSVHDHVSGGSYAPSQFVSTCATWEAVVMFAAHSTTYPKQVAVINELALSNTGVAGFIDLTKQYNRLNLLHDDRAMNFARKFQEVLITGQIPASCIVQIYTI